MKKTFSVLIMLFGFAFLCHSSALALSYEEIDQNCQNLTDAQFSEYSKSLIGKRVTWTGKVTDVSENWLNPNYEVKIDMDETGVFDVSFDVPKSLALQLKKNAYYKFTGTIKRVTKVLGVSVVTLENVSFK